MMPSGAPRASFHGGNLCSSGRIKMFPSGDSPTNAIRITLQTTSVLPNRANRVAISSTPTSPSVIRKFDGSRKKPTILESGKNMRSAALFLPRLVPRFGFLVRRIEAREFDALLHFGHHPGLVQLMLGAFLRDEIELIFRDQHRAVVIDHDDVARKHRHAAAADRLVPTHEREPVDRGRRRHTRAPSRQFRL